MTKCSARRQAKAESPCLPEQTARSWRGAWNRHARGGRQHSAVPDFVNDMIGTPGGSEWWHRGCLNLFRHTRESMEQFSSSAPAVGSERASGPELGRRTGDSLCALASLVRARPRHRRSVTTERRAGARCRRSADWVGVPVSAVTDANGAYALTDPAREAGDRAGQDRRRPAWKAGRQRE